MGRSISLCSLLKNITWSKYYQYTKLLFCYFYFCFAILQSRHKCFTVELTLVLLEFPSKFPIALECHRRESITLRSLCPRIPWSSVIHSLTFLRVVLMAHSQLNVEGERLELRIQKKPPCSEVLS